MCAFSPASTHHAASMPSASTRADGIMASLALRTACAISGRTSTPSATHHAKSSCTTTSSGASGTTTSDSAGVVSSGWAELSVSPPPARRAQSTA